jgi:CP family cyanate transporter-like MFS transporter
VKAEPRVEPPRAPAVLPGTSRGSRDARRGATPTTWLALAGLVLLAGNLRAPISSLGSVLQHVRADLGLSASTAGLVTSLPLLCFGVVGAVTPWLARRWGVDRVIGASLAVLTIALVARVVGGSTALVAGTLVLCTGIAVANVLLPVVAKQRFPSRVGPVTGVYTAALAAGSAMAAAVSAPVADRAGWQVGLGSWAVLAAVALGTWGALVVRAPGPPRRIDDTTTPASSPAVGPLLRYPVTWALTVFFGAQAVIAYVQMGWLPAIYVDAGTSQTTAGALLAGSILIGVPVYFVVPVLAVRLAGQRVLAIALSVVTAAALIGLMLSPARGAWVWAALLGLGSGAFPLALTLFVLRGASVAQTAALSAIAQSAGYLLAAVGPLAVGVLRDATGAWTVPLTALLGVVAAQGIAGCMAGRNVVVDSPVPRGVPSAPRHTGR